MLLVHKNIPLGLLTKVGWDNQQRAVCLTHVGGEESDEGIVRDDAVLCNKQTVFRSYLDTDRLFGANLLNTLD